MASRVVHCIIWWRQGVLPGTLRNGAAFRATVKRGARPSSSIASLGLSFPFAAKQAIHGRVGDLTIHDTALAEEAFLREPESTKEACRTLVPGIGVGFDAIQVQVGKRVAQERRRSFMHVSLAPGSGAEDEADPRRVDTAR